MGRSVVTSHSKGKKRKYKEISRTSLPISFFAKKKSDVVSVTVSNLDQGQCPSALSSSSDMQHKKQCSLPGFLQEILWAIQTVLTNSSLRSCVALSELFGKFFRDNVIRKSFTLGRTKYSYFMNFDIALYLKELLLAKLKSSDFFVTCHDESFSQVFQEEQMHKEFRYGKILSRL